MPGIVDDARDRIHVRPRHFPYRLVYSSSVHQSSTTRTHPPSSEYRHRRTIAPASGLGRRPLRGRFLSPFRNSRSNTIVEATDLQHVPVHEPATVQVSDCQDRRVCFPSVFLTPMNNNFCPANLCCPTAEASSQRAETPHTRYMVGSLLFVHFM